MQRRCGDEVSEVLTPEEARGEGKGEEVDGEAVRWVREKRTKFLRYNGDTAASLIKPGGGWVGSPSYSEMRRAEDYISFCTYPCSISYIAPPLAPGNN
jgi:hypothetical protein